MAQKKPKQNKESKQDYEKLGKLLVNLGEMGYADKSKLYRMEFLKGVLRGFGSVLGATIVITIVLFILSLFDNVPLVGDVVDKIQESLNSNE